MRKICILFTAIFCCLSAVANAQSAKVYEANKARIGLMTGSSTGTYVKIGADLSNVLDTQYGLRIVPMLGRGSQSNIDDLLYLNGADMGLVQSDVLTQIRLIDPSSEALKKISYIAKIYNEELHVLTSRNSDIKTISDLQGKRVSTGGIGSGSLLTARLVLKFLDIGVVETTMANTDALQALRSGEIDAMMFVAGKPTSFGRSITNADGLRLVAVPYSNLLSGTYQPSQFSSLDYPALVSEKFVETISVGAVLAVYDDHAKNSSRYAALIAFCKALLESRALFDNPARHEKWSEYSAENMVPGWRRFEPMVKLLAGENFAPGRTIEEIMQTQ